MSHAPFSVVSDDDHVDTQKSARDDVYFLFRGGRAQKRAQKVEYKIIDYKKL